MSLLAATIHSSHTAEIKNQQLQGIDLQLHTQTLPPKKESGLCSCENQVSLSMSHCTYYLWVSKKTD